MSAPLSPRCGVSIPSPGLVHLRIEAQTEVDRAVDDILLPDVVDDLSNESPPFADAARRLTAALFVDDASVWPLATSRYYLGMLPPVPGVANLPVSHARVFARVLACWHTASIRLAALICCAPGKA